MQWLLQSLARTNKSLYIKVCVHFEVEEPPSKILFRCDFPLNNYRSKINPIFCQLYNNANYARNHSSYDREFE